MRCKRWMIRIGAFLTAAALWLGAWQLRTPVGASGNTEPQPRWILKDDSGRLAQYAGAEQAAAPVRIYPVYTALLPEPDAERLREGIPVYSDEELRRLVEDLGG